jgi:hypothetical protein
MMVAIITLEQKDLLIGKLFNADSYFNPVQDINNNWVISEEEIHQYIYDEFLWIKDLELIPFVGKIQPF